MTYKLLNCPFCGGPAELLVARLSVTVECRWCDSRVGKVIDGKTAIEKWNRRPDAAEAVRLEREACLEAVLGERLVDEDTQQKEDFVYNSAIGHAAAAIRARNQCG